MKTREKGYDDYGFEPGEEKKIKEYCRSVEFCEHEELLRAAISANQAIAGDLFYSILNGVSYENLTKIRYVPYSKNDFYGYRRKCLALLRNILIARGKYEEQNEKP